MCRWSTINQKHQKKSQTLRSQSAPPIHFIITNLITIFWLEAGLAHCSQVSCRLASSMCPADAVCQVYDDDVDIACSGV